MNSRRHIVFNATAAYFCWFACILGAANDINWLGPAVVIVNVAIHLALSRNRLTELVLIGVVALIGTTLDSALRYAGFLNFNDSSQYLIPMWMIALWVNFATTINVSLRFLSRRIWLTIVLGAIGGPSTYYGGVKLGALGFHANQWQSIIAVGVEWAIAAPLLLWLSARLHDASTTESNSFQPDSISKNDEVRA